MFAKPNTEPNVVFEPHRFRVLVKLPTNGLLFFCTPQTLTELGELAKTYFPVNLLSDIPNAMYAILPTSELADFFHFKHIHHDQVLVLIKHLTKYLGKTSTMLTLCPKLKFTQCKPSDPVIFWIENLIAANHKHGSPNTLRLTLE
jgi:hypothetical protein